MADESGDAAADPTDEVAGVAGDDVGRRGGGNEAAAEHGVEELGAGLGDQRGVPDYALREGGVLLQAQAPGEEWVADEPDGEVIAAVDVELAQELVAQALRTRGSLA